MNENHNKPEQSQFQVDSFEYNLSSQIGYAESGKGSAGQKLYVDKVTLVSPLVKLLIKSRKLAQMIGAISIKTAPVFGALRKHFESQEPKLLEMEKKKEVKEEKEEDSQTPVELGDALKMTVMISDLDFEAAIFEFQQLALLGSVLVEGKNINFIQWDEISQPDQVEMFFQFIGVFIMPSLFPVPKEETE